MSRAIDVGQWLLDQGETRALHMQKLSYFAQVWSLVWTGRRLVEGEFEAWPKGPVSRDIYREFTYYRTGYKLANADVSNLDASDEAVLAAVKAHYGSLTGDELVEVSHDEAWAAARGDLPAQVRSTKAIDLTIALREYSRKALMSNDVPRRPGAALCRPFSTVEVLAEAHKQDQRWAVVHERLASA